MDSDALRALRSRLAKEMFQTIDLGNKLYNTPSEEAAIQKKADDKMKKILAIDKELRARESGSPASAKATKKRKASKTPSSSS